MRASSFAASSIRASSSKLRPIVPPAPAVFSSSRGASGCELEADASSHASTRSAATGAIALSIAGASMAPGVEDDSGGADLGGRHQVFDEGAM